MAQSSRTSDRLEPGRTTAPEDDVTVAVGSNLRRLRTRRGLSLERLAQASGVSRAMLNQIELGRSVPTIKVVFRIAHAFGLPFSALLTGAQPASITLLPVAEGKILTSHDGKFRSRALFPFDAPRSVEFYELRLAPHSEERAEPHAPGTTENLVVQSGTLEILVGNDLHRLETGDALMFQADLPHAYRNPGDADLVMYLVMTYAESVR